MKIGIETSSVYRCFKKYNCQLFFPKIKIGYFHDKYEGERWVGFNVTLINDVHFEIYDYGWIFSFVLLGFGFIINRYNV